MSVADDVLNLDETKKIDILLNAIDLNYLVDRYVLEEYTEQELKDLLIKYKKENDQYDRF